MKKLFNNIFKKRKNRDKIYQGHTEHLKKFLLSKNIDDNTGRLLDIMNNSFDIKTRNVKIAGTNVRGTVVYIDNLTNENEIEEHIIKPLLFESADLINSSINHINLNVIKDSIITIDEIKEASSFDEIVLGVMSGDTFLCVQGYKKGLLINTREYAGKSFNVPNKEQTVKGAQEGLVETLKWNISFIRKRIRDPNLSLESFAIGRRAKTDAVIIYIKGIVNTELVEEVRGRLGLIDVDNINSVVEIGNLISDKPGSIFPLVQATERVDRLVAALVEGRVAILMDGSAESIIAPATLPMLMQSIDDYYENWIVVSLVRLTRYLGLFISTLLPSLHIAVTSFNPGMLPTKLVKSIVAARTGVPFPAYIEVFLMEFTIELLQEAGIRLPKVAGQAVSIVGGLVIGQAAIQSNIVSPIMVITISISALASYQITDYSLSLATRVLRVPFILLASILGSFGVATGMIFLLVYITSLKSFGYRYLSPLTPYNLSDFKDTIFRSPLVVKERRPEFLNTQDSVRAKNQKGNRK